MNFDELMKMLPSTGSATLPKADHLPDSPVLLNKDLGFGSITVYANGLYTYREGKRVSVFAVDRCANYVDPMDTNMKKIPYAEIAELEWYYPLMMFGTSRIEKNIKRQDDEHVAFHLNNNGTDYTVKGRSVQEILEEREEERELKEKMAARKESFGQVMDSLTQVQQTCVVESYFNNKTKTQIGKELGVSQQAVSKNIEAGLKKARKAYKKLGID